MSEKTIVEISTYGDKKMNEEFWNALDKLVKNSEIVIDRPKGTKHPKYPDFIYRVNYGYLKDITSMDGAGIDIWVGTGPQKIDAIIYQTHNETQYMKGILIRR